MMLNKIVMFLVFSFGSLMSFNSSAGGYRVDSFSWQASDTGVTIINASASVNGGGPICFTGTYCGISISFVYLDNSSIQTIFTNLIKSTISSFTAEQAVAYINTLAGQTFRYPSGVTPLPTVVTCTLTLGDQVMDFGDISAAAFVSAGAGNVPSGVDTLEKTVSVSCSSATTVNLSVQASSVSGNMIVSSEKNVGFKLAFGSNSPGSNPVTPNNSSSTFAVTTNSSGIGSTVVKGIPVSVTGTKPTAGAFSAVATLQAAWD